MASNLITQQCKAYQKGSSPLTPDKISEHLTDLDSGWSLSSNKKSIGRDFKFKNYYETMAFVNIVAALSHQQDHHPDMTVSYNLCHVEYTTHSVGGLSENDFICAAKLDKALQL